MLNRKKRKMMRTNYKVRCPQCGSETELKRRTRFGGVAKEGFSGYIETEIPIRCPHCLGRLNRTEEQFRRQLFEVGLCG